MSFAEYRKSNSGVPPEFDGKLGKYVLDLAMTKNDTGPRQGGIYETGRIEAYGERGVWVPDGMTAAEIMIGAKAVSRAFDIDDFQARSIVRVVLEAIRQHTSAETPDR